MTLVEASRTPMRMNSPMNGAPMNRSTGRLSPTAMKGETMSQPTIRAAKRFPESEMPDVSDMFRVCMTHVESRLS